MGNIVQWRVAHRVVRIMDNVELAVKDHGNVDVTRVGMEWTVLLHWNKIAAIIKTMIKVYLEKGPELFKFH